MDFATGTIRKLCDRYGFIRADKDFGGGDYFFLPMTVEPKGTPWTALVEGSAVTFVPTEHEKGLRATKVRVIPAAVMQPSSSDFLGTRL